MSDAAVAPSGSSILTSGMPPPASPAPPPAAGSADEAVREVQDGPPEYIPAKYWDGTTKTPKIEDLGRGYQNLEKLLGREKVPLPVNDEDEEGWQRWYAASGRPEAPDKYEFKRPDRLPEGIEYDEDLEKNFRSYAHANGLNKKQANALYEGFVKTQLDRQSAYQTHVKQAKSTVEADLRREYGAQYEGALANAKAAMQKYADPEYFRYLDETGMGNDPRMIRAWIKVGREMGGATKLKGSAAPETTPEDLKSAIGAFDAKHRTALFDKSHPDHDRAVRERSKLFEALHAGAQA